MVFSEAGDPPIPSKLRKPDNKYDEMEKRVKIVKNYSEKLGIHAPLEYRNDEHYWFTVMKWNHEITKDLRNKLPDNEQLKEISLGLATKFSEKLLKEEECAATDKLTQAPTRAVMYNFLENLIKKPRENTKTGFLLFDLDEFKPYNDTYGHPAGDELLKEVYKILSKNTRAIDLVFRLAGDEGGIVFPNIPSDEANDLINKRAEKIRKEIFERAKIKMTIGTTLIKESDKNVDDAYGRADKNLYNAKVAGRNCTYSDNGLITRRS
jgi:diguanylate cyclase (GGDEF)-like protein